MNEQCMIFRKTPRTGWRTGQAILEVAITIPLLVLLLVIITDGGRMFFTYIQVNEAARAGAQYGAQNFTTAKDNTGMQNAAIAAAPNIPGMTAAATSFCCCPNSTETTCTNFGSGTATGSFASSCGVDPINTQKCPDWRRYEQVTTKGTFKTLLNYPGLASSITFNGASILRAR